MEPHEYSTPQERARQRALDALAAKRRTAIAVAMIHFDNMPPVYRAIAHEFTVADINTVRKHLGFEHPVTDEQWGEVRSFLMAHRARRQEDILSGRLPYC